MFHEEQWRYKAEAMLFFWQVMYRHEGLRQLYSYILDMYVLDHVHTCYTCVLETCTHGSCARSVHIRFDILQQRLRLVITSSGSVIAATRIVYEHICHNANDR
jgi:hypothetical protein